MRNIERKIQNASEQLNWTNTTLRGMETHTFVTNDYARKTHIDQLQVSTNKIIYSVNQMQQKIYEVKSDVEVTRNLVQEEKGSLKENHEELRECLDQAFTEMGKRILKVTEKPQNKPIHASHLPPPKKITSNSSTVYTPEETNVKKNISSHFPPEAESSSHSLITEYQPSTHILPAREPLPLNMNRSPAPNLYGRGRLPEAQSFTDDWYSGFH
jgi:hypothetical protein